MLSITATDAWRAAHPGAAIGLLEISGVVQPPTAPALQERKRQTVALLRQRYAGFRRPDFLALPPMPAYERYYKRFSKTYHVLLQVESIVLKGKDLPTVSPLVDANFASEVQTFILTAGHDVAMLRRPVVMDVSLPGDEMTLMSGAGKAILAGDMIMRDAAGICCSIIYGQDNRSPISMETTHVLYVSYAPAGVLAELVDAHLRQIVDHVRLFSPAAVVQQLRLIVAPVG